MAVTDWKTKIADTREDAIFVRGYDMADLIGRVSFGEMFYLLLRGELPPDRRVGKLIEAMLVSCAEHGIITTSVAARYAVASGTPIQGALAAGLLMIGDVYGGAVEQAARYFHEQSEKNAGTAAEELAVSIVGDLTRGERVPGFGHPLHSNGDPRSIRLFALAQELGLAGRCTQLAIALQHELGLKLRRLVPVNADGALAALALDLGFDWRLTRSFMLLSRTAGILAHAGEEILSGSKWRLPPPAEYPKRAHEDYYEGLEPRPLPVDYKEDHHDA